MKKTAYVNGHILDGSIDMQPVEGKAIIVDGETIEAIVPAKELKKKNYRVVDLKGAYITCTRICRRAARPRRATKRRTTRPCLRSSGWSTGTRSCGSSSS